MHRSTVGILLGRTLRDAIKKTFPTVGAAEEAFLVQPCTQPGFGHYQFNGAMGISKELTRQSIGALSPVEVARRIVDAVPPSDLVGSLSVAGPGFINIELDRRSVGQRVLQIAAHGVRSPGCEPRTVIVDFSSPNIAKEMHVGHLRSTIIGDALCRVLEYLGHRVSRVNHVGDWGTQFGMLTAYLKSQPPPTDEQAELVVRDLQRMYQLARARFDTDAEFKRFAQEEVLRLQVRRSSSRFFAAGGLP
jgi:arginyl-tRNA synthetase